jgi:hypothetical protein
MGKRGHGHANGEVECAESSSLNMRQTGQNAMGSWVRCVQDGLEVEFVELLCVNKQSTSTNNYATTSSSSLTTLS